MISMGELGLGPILQVLQTCRQRRGGGVSGQGNPGTIILRKV